MAAGETPAKRVRRPAKKATPQIPSDQEVIQAVVNYQRKSEASRAANEAEMEARKRLVEVLHARGITGFVL